MKVYVVYDSYEFDGCSAPYSVHRTFVDAANGEEFQVDRQSMESEWYSRTSSKCIIMLDLTDE